MSGDYNLKKIYEQMLNGKTPERTNSKPRTLTEAYKHVVAEKIAFFSQDLDANQQPIKDPRLVPLGVVINDDEGKRIKSAVLSHSITNIADDLLTKAGWETNNPVLASNAFAQELVYLDIDTTDLTNILQHRSELKGVEEELKKSMTDHGDFKLLDAIYNGITKNANIALKTDHKNLEKLFNFLYNKSGKATTKGATSIGPGEMLISLFSNSSKPIISGSDKEDETIGGDLVFGNLRVELKSTGAVLGYSPHSESSLRTEMVKVMKQGAILNRNVSGVKQKFLQKIKELNQKITGSEEDKTNPVPHYTLFTTELIKSLTEIKNSLGSNNLSKILVDTGFDQLLPLVVNDKGIAKGSPKKAVQPYINAFASKGYLDLKNSKAFIGNKSIDELYVSLSKDIYDIIISTRIFIAESTRKSAKNITVPEFTKMSWTTAVQEFFLTNLGLTPAQMSEVFFNARPETNDVSSTLQSDIANKVTEQVVSDLGDGDTDLLKKFLFAIHISEYARIHNFNCLMLVNKQKATALGIYVPNTNGFNVLFDTYDKIKNKIKFEIQVGSYGAYGISLL